MILTEKQKNKNYIYKGKILNLRCDDILLPSGVEAKREIIEHSGGSAILLINENNEVLFVRQFRYAYNEELLEIPAGKLNIGEKPISAAIRELKEETGYVADIKEYGVVYPSPGYTNEKIYLFLALNYKVGECSLDEDEFLNLEYIHLNKVIKMIDDGEIKDSKTIIAIQKYLIDKQIKKAD
jgi:ADP-ribose pyrophosphatase